MGEAKRRNLAAQRETVLVHRHLVKNHNADRCKAAFDALPAEMTVADMAVMCGIMIANVLSLVPEQERRAYRAGIFSIAEVASSQAAKQEGEAVV